MSEHAGIMDALLAFQADAPTLQKDKINPAFKSKYLSLDTLMGQVLPALNKHGLIWMTFPVADEQGNPALRYSLHHVKSGSELTGKMPLLLAKQDAQAFGGAITYARRYSLMAVLGLVADEDDDGGKASGKQAPPKQVPQGQLATAKDVEEMSSAAKGLKASQIKMALTACGVPTPQQVTLDTLASVPRVKVPFVVEKLVGIAR